MKRFSDRTYHFLRALVRGIMHIGHPIIHIRGRENVPEGAAIVVANHVSLSDPIWVHLGLKEKHLPMTMGKKELFDIFFLGWLYRKIGAFPVDREGADIQAIKTSLKCLQDDTKLVIFPEGTRVRNGKESQVHNGAVMLACKANVPIVPIYLSVKRRLFCSIHILIDKPYKPQYEGKKPTGEELQKMSNELMQSVYRMGEKL